MELCNIRIINAGRNKYNGSVIINEDKTVLGICTEENYDNEHIIKGNITKTGFDFEILSETEKIPVSTEKVDFFVKHSIVEADCYSGCSIDAMRDTIFVEMTNVKKIEQKIKAKKKELNY